ncbi:MAG: TetR/AcrR family transcriptional regulator [Streptosporangiales bacterium]|jgi:AcrR family transcriptional regulator|nr:TetR/AcrR family transcriptional regulator [Streptosporangiales bacterium]
MAADVDWLAGGQRRDLALRAIRAAARQQLLDEGIGRFTVEAVARRAGCSRATVYRVAGGKKALLDAVLAAGAAEVAEKVAGAVMDLSGEDRVVEAILAGLREVRRDSAVNEWVRQTVVGGDVLQNSDDLSSLAGTWTDGAGVSLLEGQWILRVFLQFVAWPAADEDSERTLVRDFVGPAFRPR